jgi:hypothetical protein
MAYIGKEPNRGLRNRFTYTATAGQATFSGADDNSRTLTYNDSYFVEVHLNGVLLDGSDYTATSGTSIVLDEAAAVDDILEVVVYDTFSVFSGEFSADVTVGGTLTANGNVDVNGNELILDADGDTSITADTDDQIDFKVAGSNVAYVNANGVGVGTVPATNVAVDVRTNATTNSADFRNSNSGGFGLYTAAGSSSSQYALRAADYQNNALFSVVGDGDVLIGTTSAGGAGGLTIDPASQAGAPSLILNRNNTTATSYSFIFRNAGSDEGYIQYNQSGVSFLQASDYRLKENVVDITDGITRLKQLDPKRFNWIHDETNTLIDGFLAHNVQSVVPEAVDGTKDATRTAENVVLNSDGDMIAENVTQQEWTDNKGSADDDLYPDNSTWTATHTAIRKQFLDQTKLVPLLTAALQEAITKIEALETENADFETRIAALEAN